MMESWAFTRDALDVMFAAGSIAARNGSAFLEPQHVLAALLEANRAAIPAGGRTRSVPPISPSTKVLIQVSFAAALPAREEAITRAHLAAALMQCEDYAVQHMLWNHAMSGETILDRLHQIRSSAGLRLDEHEYDPRRFSQEAVDIVRDARLESILMRNGYVGTQHILMSMLRDEFNVVSRFFQSLPVANHRHRHWMGR